MKCFHRKFVLSRIMKSAIHRHPIIFHVISKDSGKLLEKPLKRHFVERSSNRAFLRTAVQCCSYTIKTKALLALIIVSATRRRTAVFVGPRVEKFNVVSNDRGRTHKCDFSVFDRKFPSWANFVKKKSKLSV